MANRKYLDLPNRYARNAPLEPSADEKAFETEAARQGFALREVVSIAGRSDRMGGGCGDGAYHFHVSVSRNGAPFWTGEYTMGEGLAWQRPHAGEWVLYGPEPTLADIIAALVRDSGCVDGMDAADFLAEYGYEGADGIRSGLAAFASCTALARSFARLDAEAYDRLASLAAEL